MLLLILVRTQFIGIHRAMPFRKGFLVPYLQMFLVLPNLFRLTSLTICTCREIKTLTTGKVVFGAYIHSRERTIFHRSNDTTIQTS